MNIRLANLWNLLRENFWLVPSAMAAAAVALAFIAQEVDEGVGRDVGERVFVYRGAPDGAQDMMAVIAGSMITVAGVTFSITITALVLASSQFGPSLLRNFMRDLGNQFVLGTFIATFAYCLLVLRGIRDTDEEQFVPQIAITIGIGLALLSLGVLIYFIHHIASSIQVTNLINSVAKELDSVIGKIFPKDVGLGPHEIGVQSEGALERPEEEWKPVYSPKSGYLQSVDDESLMKLATDLDIVVKLGHHPGTFILQSGAIASIWPGEKADKDLARKVNQCLVLGSRRTSTQDVEFAMDQLVEIAVRALSPGITNPQTAILCIDRLGAALVRIVEVGVPSSRRFDNAGKLRVIAKPFRFPGLVDSAFNQIRQYGQSSAAVTIRLLDTLAVIASRARTDEQRETIHQHAMMIERGSHEGLPGESNRRELQQRYTAVLTALEGSRERSRTEAVAVAAADQSD